MKRRSDGAALLNDLLDRHERGAGAARRIIARPALAFASPEQRHRLTETLTAARDTGAVSIAYDRDAAHLIAIVELIDPDRLYAHLDRTPKASRIGSALDRLGGVEASTGTGRALADFIADRWTAGRRALGLGPEAIDAALALVRAADAAMTELPGAGIALRTRSTRLLGDSKALERSLPKLLAYLKLSGRIAADLTLKEAARALGLEKFPQPVLVAGPLVVDGANISDWPYAGLPPEAGQKLAFASNVRSILTIENLESFNRHVRECRQRGDIVVYTGGFPALGVVSILCRLIELSRVPAIAHWGDIDPGGVRIGAHLERVLPVPVYPHLMAIGIAEVHGKACTARSAIKLDPASPFAELGAYLATPSARFLEQELIDPTPVAATP